MTDRAPSAARTLEQRRAGGDFDRAALARALEATRARTLALVAALPRDRLAQAAPPLGPPLWDLGHVAHFEQEWLVVRLGAPPAIAPALTERYDPERHRRDARRELESLDAVLDALARVRARALERLFDERAPPGELERGGWVWRMVRRHEEQHAEILLQWAQVARARLALDPCSPPRVPRDADAAERVHVAAGAARIGDDEGYDNERPAHARALAAFAIDRWPVTNARYLAFVRAGGYREPRWWSDAGRAWLARAPRDLPRAWHRDGDAIVVERFGLRVPLEPREPVQHVSAHEADAFARWAGARLPNEHEWEHADRLGVLALARGAVWQWTASAFEPYAGFRPWPYAGYSAAHFGRRHRVLRGGAWTVGDDLARAAYRNWDLAERDQLFAGLRLAHDGGDA